MAEEFQAEVYGGSWWSSPTATFNGSSFMANYGSAGCWQQNDYMNMMKTKSTDESSAYYTTAISPDSTAQIISSSPSSTTNWYQALLGQTLPENLNNLPDGGGQNSSDFGMDQEQTSSFMTNSGNFVNNSYGNYPSSLLQTLFDGTSSPPPAATTTAPPQQPLYDFDDDLHLTNKTVFWNTSAYEEKPKCPNFKSRNDEVRDLGSLVKKSFDECAFKRPRLETPSPLPTFKVRKEKLGDRVTALQQLVSPFGKTDTASVLHEAIEYIKLLQDQVNILSNPYMKNGVAMQVQQIHDKAEDDKDGAKQQDLRSRGLCLVPVASTFPVATETAPDYWASGFRTTFN